MKKASTKTLSLLATIGCIILSAVFSANAQSFIQTAEKTGVTISNEEGVRIWEGPYTGKMKPEGPLSGKTIGVLVASEFSDFQAQYIYSYASEFGGKVDFLKVGWVKWKFTRPNVKNKGVHGMWGTDLAEKGARYTSKSVKEANPGDYDALVVLGGHSADIMTSEEEVISFIKTVHENDGVIGAIGGGSLPLIRAGIMNGKNVTGNRVVSFMLEKIAKFENKPVVRDEKLITARNTVNTPAFLRELCKAFDPDFKPERNDILDGKKILVIAGEDFEDIELAVPVMEYLYRGAEVTLATFPAPMRSRPPMVGVDVVQGNYGMSVPLQEIPKNHYHIMKLSKVRMDDFDLVQIPGAFCPWNMVSAGEPVDFLKEAHEAGKIIAAICHGPIAVSAADLVKGKKLAGVNACKDPVEIMGGTHSGDWSAVIDGKIVSGRVPPDIPEFLDAITQALVNN
jgi:protease I